MVQKRCRLYLIGFLAGIALISSCATLPEPSVRDEVIADKGKAEGVPTPAWVPLALLGDIPAIERLPAYTGNLVVLTLSQAEDLERAEALAARVRPETEMGYYLSLRVRDLLKAVKVSGSDYISYNAYREVYEKAVDEALYTDFMNRGQWWVKLQTFKESGAQYKQVYRVIRLWAVEKKYIKRQLEAILNSVHAQAAPSAENLRAKNLIQNTLEKQLFEF